MSVDFNKEILAMEPSDSIVLFEVDLQGKGAYLFHAGENGYRRKIIFNNREYDYIPIDVQGFELSGDGRLPRPRMVISNEGGLISSKLPFFEDFLGYKVTRIKTFIKYLDPINFPSNVNPHEGADSTVEFPREVYFINQKVKEDKNSVEFELVSVLELETAKVPARTIMCNYCFWSYRSSVGCGYGGPPVANDKNKKFTESGYSDPNFIGSETFLGSTKLNPDPASGGPYTVPTWDAEKIYQKGDTVKISNDIDNSPLNADSYYVCIADNVKSDPRRDSEGWVRDACSKNIGGCRLRFGSNAPKDQEETKGLPFGGFPGTDAFGY